MNSRISIHTEHGPLYGELSHPAESRGLVVLAHAGSTPEAPGASNEQALALIFRNAGLASLTLDLLTHHENRFPDAHNNVPLLSKRLLDCLTLIKRQLSNDASIDLPIGLCGSGPTSPVVVRVAAVRDHDISTVVCRGGLIDLAGILYLRSLESPLLMLVGAADEHLVASSQRALQEVSCRTELKTIPDSDSAFASPGAFQASAYESVEWFSRHFPAADASANAGIDTIIQPWPL